MRGRVLPIGGLREKLLAAKRSGISSVILPADNRKDIEEVPEEIIKGMELIFVNHIDEVLPRALSGKKNQIFVLLVYLSIQGSGDTTERKRGAERM